MVPVHIFVRNGPTQLSSLGDIHNLAKVTSHRITKALQALENLFDIRVYDSEIHVIFDGVAVKFNTQLYRSTFDEVNKILKDLALGDDS